MAGYTHLFITLGSEYLGDTENVLTVGYGIEDFMAKMFAKGNNFLSMA